jgi:hypothetical protein
MAICDKLLFLLNRDFLKYQICSRRVFSVLNQDISPFMEFSTMEGVLLQWCSA